MSKKVAIFAIIPIIMLIINTTALAEVQNEITLIINGKQIELVTPPIVEDDNVLVPVRAVFEELGGKVSWDFSTKTITIEIMGSCIEIKVGSKIVKGFQNEVLLDVPVKIIDGNALVSLELITNECGVYVDWDKESQMVYINSLPEINVHIIDAGYGDAVFIDNGDYDILINGGNDNTGDIIIEYLKKISTDDIEILVATSPSEQKIGGLDKEDRNLASPKRKEISHMLFFDTSGWFATHPPLGERIKAIDPKFNSSSQLLNQKGMSQSTNSFGEI